MPPHYSVQFANPKTTNPMKAHHNRCEVISCPSTGKAALCLIPRFLARSRYSAREDGSLDLSRTGRVVGGEDMMCIVLLEQDELDMNTWGEDL